LSFLIPIVGLAVRIAAKKAAKALAKRAARKAVQRAAKRRALRLLRAAQRVRRVTPRQAAARLMGLARNPLIAGPILASLRFARNLFGRGSKARVFCNRVIDRIGRFLSRPDPNRLHHIFDYPKHRLGGFLRKFDGDQVKAYRAMLRAAKKATRGRGPGRFEVDVMIKGEQITIRGMTERNGVTKIGTAFKR
jgi:hypothetical protein